MLQQGLYVADVAYYYGDQAPNFWPSYHDVPEKPSIDGLGPGYEYDVVNSDVILNRMSVQDGRIVLPDGMSYRLLVLPEKNDMPLEVLIKLEMLVSSGATIIGPKPSYVPGLGDFEEKTKALRKLSYSMWGDCNGTTIKENSYGKGRVVWGYSPQEWLELESVGPDFACKNSELAPAFDFIHRQTENSDIYFVRNKTKKPVNAECLFRVNKRTPRIWDPTNGSIEEQFVYKTGDGGTSLQVTLPPGGSNFFVFDKEPGTGSFTSLTRKDEKYYHDLPDEQVLAVTENSATIHCWQNGSYLLTGKDGQEEMIQVDNVPAPLVVEFDQEWGAPAEVKLTELISWTDHPDKGLKYYSGSGKYHKTIHVPGDWLSSERKVHLDLGDVREIAEIFVNGQSAGIVWKPPFRANISSYLKAGDNKLEIEVMNLWIYRLSGDMDLPEHERFTRSNIKKDYSTYYSPAEPWHTETAGLLGPVLLLPSVEIKTNSLKQ